MTLAVGDDAPDFDLPQALDAGDNIKLSDYRGKSNVLLCFYPFDFSGPCGEQLPVYQAQSDKFESANCQVLGISVDSKFSHAAWAEKLGVEYPLLSDFPAKNTVQSYGLLHEGGFSNRAIILIDKEGKVLQIQLSPTPPELPDNDALFAALESLS